MPNKESIKLDSRMKEIVDRIERTYDHIFVQKDKQGKKHRVYEHSTIISIFSSDVHIIKYIFPYFNISQVYGMYHIVGFNKSKDWGEKRLPDLE